MTYQVRILAKAWEDLDEILAYIAERSPGGAARLLDEFDKTMSRLEVNPFIAPLALEAEDVGEEIRQALFRTRAGRNYRALFLIIGDEVRVLRVRGSGQAPIASDDLTS
ncbi:type II toxin-antitoxin system RelE/ParE family toxin [Paludisphaera rhizosphaerae]|uniref:type II toxin-antitoxin system RelE/ParE family toxin n=1 Tax=Paludisphaera rhizosphaerae TaxID=2711216 RepID=UPI0013EDFE85|nr:type II toxin-antitoxin system RelE/ParE family toxin [Paludisphaera rhizosphaerae]